MIFSKIDHSIEIIFSNVVIFPRSLFLSFTGHRIRPANNDQLDTSFTGNWTHRPNDLHNSGFTWTTYLHYLLGTFTLWRNFCFLAAFSLHSSVNTTVLWFTQITQQNTMIQIHRNTNEHNCLILKRINMSFRGSCIPNCPLKQLQWLWQDTQSFEYSQKYTIVFVRSAPLAMFLSLNYLNNRNLANRKSKTLYPNLREIRITHHKCVSGNTT